MSKAKPDAYRLAVFLAIKAQFDPSYSAGARAMWDRWVRYAKKRRVEPGTPRSFSNALRKLGCPSYREEGRRRRYHRGVRLAPSWLPERPEYQAIYTANETGRKTYLTHWYADKDGEPLFFKKRGLLPGRWVPARIISRGGKIVVQELP